METKRCFKCGRILPLDSFYKHPEMRDGHLNKCKDCTKNDVKNKYLENSQSESYMEKERDRGREKYHRLRYGAIKTERKAKKEKKYGSLRNAKRDFHVSLSRDIELHHWNYNITDCVFVLEKRLHRRLHQSITLNLDEGIYYRGEEKLDTVSKHFQAVTDVCQQFGFNPTKVRVLRKDYE